MNYPNESHPAAEKVSGSIYQMPILSLLLFSLFCSSGCVRDHAQYSTFMPGLKFSPDTRVVIEKLPPDTSTKPTGVPAAFNPEEELAAALEMELKKAGLKGQPNTPDVIVLLPIIADYEGGNAFVRSVAVVPESGRTLLLVRCKLKRNGTEIGTINVRRTWEAFSVASAVASIGQWKTIIHEAAADIVKELILGIRSNQ